MAKKIVEKLFPEGTKRRQFIRIIGRFIKGINITNIKKIYKNIKLNGFSYTFKKIKMILSGNFKVQNIPEYHAWIVTNEPTEEELEKQRTHKFKISPKISIIVPMYKTPINFFEELVDCLINQTYTNWELCLADGSEEKNEEIEKIVKKDERIKYHFIGENKNISGNTNEALKLATGDYIGLLDHDDLLPIFSLYEVVNAINKNPEAEFLYSDEDKINRNS